MAKLPHLIRTYVIRETAIGAMVNALLSVAVFLAVFGRHPAIPVWGMGQLAFDFAPQSFGVAFMSILIPGLIARRNLRAGKVPAFDGPSVLPRHLLGRSLVVGVVSACVGGASWALLLRFLGAGQFSWSTALMVKAAYGASLGSITIVMTLPAALRDH